MGQKWGFLAGGPFWGGYPPLKWGVFGGETSKKCKKRAPGQNMPLYQILVHQFCKKNGLWSRNLTLEQSSPPWEPYFWWVFQALFTPPTKNGHFSARKPAVSLRIFILKCDIRGWYNSSAKSNFWGFLGVFGGVSGGPFLLKSLSIEFTCFFLKFHHFLCYFHFASECLNAWAGGGTH